MVFTQRMEEICVELTNFCPADCVHCSSHASIESIGSHIPLMKLREIIDDLYLLGCSIFEISGGEPLYHPNLLEVIQYAKRKGMEVRLYTSGQFIPSSGGNTGISQEKARKLLNAGTDKIIFNLQAFSPDIHDSITKLPGSFDIALKGIQNLKKLHGWVGVHYVPMRPNINEFSGLAELCLKLKVNELAILRFVPQGRGKAYIDKLEISKEQFDSLLCEISDLYEEYLGLLKIRVGCPMNFCSFYNPNIQPVLCKAAKSTCYIMSSGDVIPCPAFKDTKQYTAGNIFIQSLKEIWEAGGSFTELRNFEISEIDGHCNSCSQLQHCQGRCIAQRLLKYGNIYRGPDPLCIIGIISKRQHEKDHALARVI